MLNLKIDNNSDYEKKYPKITSEKARKIHMKRILLQFKFFIIHLLFSMLHFCFYTLCTEQI